MSKKLLSILGFSLGVMSLQAQSLNVNFLGRYTDGRETACEISAYDKNSAKLFITNAASDSIDIINVSNASNPVKIGGINIDPYGGGVNSVAVVNGTHLAAAIEGNSVQDSGKVVFFDLNGAFVSQVTVGFLPDMIAVTPDGSKVLTANEGEPNDAYTIDPNGSVSIINISGGIANLNNSNVTTLNFTNAPNSIAGALRKPNTPWTQDLEPEYIAINQNSDRAYVICQEANVLITINLTTMAITNYQGLGFKDHNAPGNMLDASNRDNGINIRNWPVKGIYMPDAIAVYTVNGVDYIVTANEGDARDYDGYSSESRIKDLTLDPTAFPNAAALQQDSALGRLQSITADVIGDTDNDGDIDELYCYGARSFSIFSSNGLVWDSGDEFENYFATNFPAFFNCNDGLASEFDERSDDKGPEPEAVAVGKIGNKFFAFIGLERQGGFMIYDITNPMSPNFVDFINTYDTVNGTMTDMAPEGLLFIPDSMSHTGKNLVIISHELSGTTSIYEVIDPSIGIEEGLMPNIKIFPNPTHDKVSIQCEASINGNYTLVDILGKTLSQGNFIHNTTIALDAFTSGVYVLVLRDAQNNEILTQKIIKK